MKQKSCQLSVRVTEQTRDEFIAKATQYGLFSEVLRELIDAFVEDRITIKPPVNRNFKGLYSHE